MNCSNFNKLVGSSETTREASDFNFKPFYDNAPHFNHNLPDTSFLEWFIGFTEGDGSFGLQKSPTLSNPNNTRPYFVINQEESQVLYKIQKSLGYGVVDQIHDKITGQHYFRYTVTKIEHIAHLIHLYNGNLILKKSVYAFKNGWQALIHFAINARSCIIWNSSHELIWLNFLRMMKFIHLN